MISTIHALDKVRLIVFILEVMKWITAVGVLIKCQRLAMQVFELY